MSMLSHNHPLFFPLKFLIIFCIGISLTLSVSVTYISFFIFSLEYSYQLESSFMDRPNVAKYMDAGAEKYSGENEKIEECPYEILGLEKGAPAPKVRVEIV